MTPKEYTPLVGERNRAAVNDFAGLRETARVEPWWFAEGLRFQCLGCGRCCRGEGGGIFLCLEDERRIAAFLGLPVCELRRNFETRRWRFPSLKERSDGACVMLNDCARCKIYDIRPVHCRTWPFWPQLLESPAAWKAAARRCPGMDYGELWSGERIAKILRAHEDFTVKLQQERQMK